MDPRGNMVVSYTRNVGASGELDARVVMLTRTGAFVRSILVAATGSLVNAHSAEVARSPGSFAVVYVRGVPGNEDVYLARYTARGVLLGNHPVSTGLSDDASPTVSMDRFGNAVVVWEFGETVADHDLHAKRVSKAGVVSSTIALVTHADYQYAPDVAMHRSSGAFVVTYRTEFISSYVLEVSPLDNVGPEVPLGEFTFSARVAIDERGVYHIGYEDDQIVDQYGLLFGRQ
jgi:hypothetical protein